MYQVKIWGNAPHPKVQPVKIWGSRAPQASLTDRLCMNYAIVGFSITEAP